MLAGAEHLYSWSLVIGDREWPASTLNIAASVTDIEGAIRKEVVRLQSKLSKQTNPVWQEPAVMTVGLTFVVLE